MLGPQWRGTRLRGSDEEPALCGRSVSAAGQNGLVAGRCGRSADGPGQAQLAGWELGLRSTTHEGTLSDHPAYADRVAPVADGALSV